MITTHTCNHRLSRIIGTLAFVLALTCRPLSASELGDADFPKPSPSARHDAKVEAVRSGEYDLALIGDSIFHTLDKFGGKYAPLEAVWDKYYAPHRAINLAHTGRDFCGHKSDH